MWQGHLMVEARGIEAGPEQHSARGSRCRSRSVQFLGTEVLTPVLMASAHFTQAEFGEQAPVPTGAELPGGAPTPPPRDLPGQ